MSWSVILFVESYQCLLDNYINICCCLFQQPGRMRSVSGTSSTAPSCSSHPKPSAQTKVLLGSLKLFVLSMNFGKVLQVNANLLTVQNLFLKWQNIV